MKVVLATLAVAVASIGAGVTLAQGGDSARPAAPLAVSPVSGVESDPLWIEERRMRPERASRASSRPSPSPAKPVQNDPVRRTGSTPRRAGSGPGGGESFSPGSVVALIHEAAAKYRLSAERLVSLAKCESGLNPRAIRRGKRVNFIGPFQQADIYWEDRAARYGFAGISIWNTRANVFVSVAMIAGGGEEHWSCNY